MGSDGPVQSSSPWAWEFCILCVIKISTQKHFINRYCKVCVHCLSSSFGCYWNPAILSPRKQTPFEKLSFGAKENYVGSSEELVQWLNLDKITPWCFPSPLFPPNDINGVFYFFAYSLEINVMYSCTIHWFHWCKQAPFQEVFENPDNEKTLFCYSTNVKLTSNKTNKEELPYNLEGYTTLLRQILWGILWGKIVKCVFVNY